MVDNSNASPREPSFTIQFRAKILATLNSNNGVQSLTICLVDASQFLEQDGFETNLKIKTEHWDGDHEYPITLEVEGLFFSLKSLKRMCDKIDSWVDLPLDELAKTDFALEIEFPATSQDVVLSFGERDDLITSQNVGFGIRITSERFSAQTSFATDQSCMTGFSRCLRREISELTEGER